MFALLTLIGFFMVWQSTGDIVAGRSMAFLVMALSQVIHSFNMRSSHSLFKTGIFTNRYLNGAAFISLALLALVAFLPPVAFAFGLTQLSAVMYFYALGLALVPVLVLEFSKAFGLVKHQA